MAANLFKSYQTKHNFMTILPCQSADIPDIMALYAAARRLQTDRKMVVWPFLEADFIQREIDHNKQWKAVIDGQIVCNWVVTLEDTDIWEARDQGDAIYIHRIASHPDFRGRRLIDDLVAWAKNHAQSIGRQYVRLDTLGNNTRLIDYYQSAGFDFLGVFQLTNTANLPAHYQNEPDCLLFQMSV